MRTLWQLKFLVENAVMFPVWFVVMMVTVAFCPFLPGNPIAPAGPTGPGVPPLEEQFTFMFTLFEEEDVCL